MSYFSLSLCTTISFCFLFETGDLKLSYGMVSAWLAPSSDSPWNWTLASEIEPDESAELIPLWLALLCTSVSSVLLTMFASGIAMLSSVSFWFS